MLLWKNYGGGKPAAIQTRPDRQSLVMGSDRIAAQAFPLLPPPCFSHKTLRGHFFCGEYWLTRKNLTGGPAVQWPEGGDCRCQAHRWYGGLQMPSMINTPQF